MKYSLNSKGLVDTKADCLVVALPDNGEEWSASAQAADLQTDGALRQGLKHGDFSGKLGATSILPLTGKHPWKRILLVGAGKMTELHAGNYRKLLLAAFNRLRDLPIKSALIALTDRPVIARDESWRVSYASRCAEEAMYRFTEFKSQQPPAITLDKLVFEVSESNKALEHALVQGAGIGRGMNLTRTLGNTPGNVCTPDWLAKQAKGLAKVHDSLSVEVLGEKEMKALGMHCLLSVSAGSAEPARLIILQYQGGKAKEKPHVLVGKGITFDTGGISLKPGEAMDEMKYDMCGAASVLGVMQTLAELRPAINVIGVIAAAENMPSGTA
ncbi:MAG: leucyl aminopeptidase, partial [Gammaproteobacteria bacterium]|nr:leucyl aminopeptidase [Gammaproteobacteria bacterium]